jgi:hypothetical protein
MYLSSRFFIFFYVDKMKVSMVLPVTVLIILKTFCNYELLIDFIFIFFAVIMMISLFDHEVDF